MEHLPSSEEQVSVKKHTRKKHLGTFLKIFFVIAFIGIAFSLSISGIKKFILFPELKGIHEKLIQFSNCIDDIKTLKKEKEIGRNDILKLQEELNELKQKLDLLYKNPPVVNEDLSPLPTIKNIEPSTNLPYINFIHALKERVDFDDAFKNIAHLKLSQKCLDLVGQLKKVYVSNLTVTTLQKDFDVLYTKIKETDHTTRNNNIFQRVKNYLINNIHVSFKDSTLLLSPETALKNAKDKMEKKDIKGALTDMLPLKSLDEASVWIDKSVAYLHIEKLIEKLNALEGTFES